MYTIPVKEILCETKYYILKEICEQIIIPYLESPLINFLTNDANILSLHENGDVNYFATSPTETPLNNVTYCKDINLIFTNDHRNQIYKYDFKTWTKCSYLPEPNTAFQLVYKNSKLYACGIDNMNYAIFYIYDIVTDTWQKIECKRDVPGDYTTQLLYFDNKIIASLDYVVEIIDLTTYKVSYVERLPSREDYNTHLVEHNGSILAFVTWFEVTEKRTTVYKLFNNSWISGKYKLDAIDLHGVYSYKNFLYLVNTDRKCARISLD